MNLALFENNYPQTKSRGLPLVRDKTTATKISFVIPWLNAMIVNVDSKLSEVIQIRARRKALVITATGPSKRYPVCDVMLFFRAGSGFCRKKLYIFKT